MAWTYHFQIIDAILCVRLGLSYYVETDWVEYFLPGGFIGLPKELLAQIKWHGNLKKSDVKMPEVTGFLTSLSGSSLCLSVVLLGGPAFTSDLKGEFGTGFTFRGSPESCGGRSDLHGDDGASIVDCSLSPR